MKHIYKLKFSDHKKEKHTLFVAENKLEKLATTNNCMTELNKIRTKAEKNSPTPVSTKLMLNNIRCTVECVCLDDNSVQHKDVMQSYCNLFAALSIVDNAMLSEFFDQNPFIEELI